MFKGFMNKFRSFSKEDCCSIIIEEVKDEKDVAECCENLQACCS
ncbi:hypothetical protein [Ferdinandcohnia sp. SAFN-114]